MDASPARHGIEALACPLSSNVAARLIRFWEGVFGESFSRFEPVLAGREAGANEDVVYVVRAVGLGRNAGEGEVDSPARGAGGLTGAGGDDDDIAATCRLTICRADRRIGLLGEVATAKAFRGRGLAARVCERARDDFARDGGAGTASGSVTSAGAGRQAAAGNAAGGRALFLATSNPAARRVYERLGWRGLPNANVMVWQPAGDTLAVVDPRTRPGEAFSVVEGSPALRAPMVPCITRDHPWWLLDANAGVCSTRFVLQPSCEGLYGRYDEVAALRGGAWLAAVTAPLQVLGLASAMPVAREHAARSAGDERGGHDRHVRRASASVVAGCEATWRIDVFTEHGRADVWRALMSAAVELTRRRGTRSWEVITAERDHEKRRWLGDVGFVDAGSAAPWIIAGGSIEVRRMSRCG